MVAMVAVGVKNLLRRRRCIVSQWECELGRTIICKLRWPQPYTMDAEAIVDELRRMTLLDDGGNVPVPEALADAPTDLWHKESAMGCG
ncbi:hypothetical protein LINGRAHAP2_LOCUS29793 [Linum grandiflorum]